MGYITTTELRTKSSQLVTSIEKGNKVSLIHRSKVVGVIQPVTNQPKSFDATAFKKLVDKLNLKPTSYVEREKRYRSHLMNKYGKGIS